MAVRRYNKPLRSVFELAGVTEPAVTDALGWVFGHSPSLCHCFVLHIGGLDVSSEECKGVEVQLQHPIGEEGFTDVELMHDSFHLIVEAKRGWSLPGAEQLRKYVGRLLPAPLRGFVTVSRADERYFERSGLAAALAPTPVWHLSWQQMGKLLDAARENSSATERRLLNDLKAYLKVATPAQDLDSNMVFVVALKGEVEPWSAIPSVDFVRRHKVYFHPVGKKWPVRPPTYIAFRYHGALMSVHYVDRVEVYADLREALGPLVKAMVPDGDHFLYHLGPPMYPDHVVRTGKLYGPGHHYCMLDALLTSSSVKEALTITKARLSRGK
ncbi:MAG: hypothetical protein ACYCO4_00305 [Sulfobacillus sp.]